MKKTIKHSNDVKTVGNIAEKIFHYSKANEINMCKYHSA